MSNKVEIRVNDLKSLMEWLEQKALLDKNYPVVIETSNASGIGPSVQVSVETAEGEGLFKDLTDYDSW